VKELRGEAAAATSQQEHHDLFLNEEVLKLHQSTASRDELQKRRYIRRGI
jgi:hypothetical protein